ncbi:hypothetical protein ETB97_008966 [Aspergillus alliaceus]|uniref:Uncharacterized protein n=1 Tax=Petromyces alliaceus TaxID=209559 RepID=A0A8H5ZTT6_PETAA|nr:hypothetical protein ETB97_008966 [Aspergillus burnettii]
MVTSPKSIQSTPATLLKDIIILQPPRSRCGCGPGLALVRPSSLTPCEGYNTSLDPTPMQKWVEESYAVVQITIDEETASEMLPVLVRTGVVALAYLSECDNKVYGSTMNYPSSFGEALRRVARTFAGEVFLAEGDIQGPALLL